jgi:uncharacterized lipoprotein YmbA
MSKKSTLSSTAQFATVLPAVRVIILALLALLIGCSTPMSEPAYYLMRGEVPESNGRLDGRVRVGIGRLIVAPYLLSSQGIVIEAAPGEVRAAHLHQWAEPLDSGLRWYLSAEIAKELGDQVGGGLIDHGNWDYTIDVYVARFHGTMSGDAILDATFVIRPHAGSQEQREYRFSKSQPQSGEGYAALVAAEQSLMTELGASIAQALQESMTP